MASWFDIMLYPDNADREKRIREFAEYYTSLTVNGFHYVAWNSSIQQVMVKKPDFSPHELSCRYLLSKGNSIGTTKGAAYALKHFCDFCMAWDYPQLAGLPISYYIEAFSDYLRCLNVDAFRIHNDIGSRDFWTGLQRLPIHPAWSLDVSRFEKKMVPQLDSFTVHGGFSQGRIRQFVSTVVDYLRFLDEKPSGDPELFGRINVMLQIPTLDRWEQTRISGTAGKEKRTYPNISALAGVEEAESDESDSISWDEVPNSYALSCLKKFGMVNHEQDRFLLYILQYMGFRRGEITGIWISPKDLPKSLRRMSEDDIIYYFKENQPTHNRTDVRWFKAPNGRSHWQIRVGKNNQNKIDTRAKNAKYNGARWVPWLFDQNVFAIQLARHLKERAWLIENNTELDHGYCFVNNRGNPISGDTVRNKIKRAILRLPDDLMMPPEFGNGLSVKSYLLNFKRLIHDLRHWYASFLLLNREHPYPLSKVSTLLGHKNESVTERTYKHLDSNFIDIHLSLEEMTGAFSSFSEWEA